jgi:ABC-2 type transport system permease protein
MRAVYVMWQRQLKEYVRKKQRLFLTLAQPLLFIVAFSFGIGGMFEQVGNGSYIQYLIPGIIGMTILMSSTMNGMSLIWDKQFGFLKETLVAPVSRTSLLFGRCLGGATTSTIQGLIVLFIGLLLDFKITNWFLLPFAIICMFLIALLFNLFGTTLASKFNDMQSFPIIMNILIMPMVFISGALFPIDNFPKILIAFIKINPFTYAINILKFSLGVFIEQNIILSFAVIIGLIIIIGAIGTYLFNKIET